VPMLPEVAGGYIAAAQFAWVQAHDS
jgi:hypothetical protein